MFNMTKGSVYAVVIATLCSCALIRRRHQRWGRGEAHAHARRIFNGVNDTTGRFPYVAVLLAIGNRRTCTGSIITSKWVLTAAHCCMPHNGALYVNYSNVSEPIIGETASEIDSCIMHQRFDSALVEMMDITRVNDIGLIYMKPAAVLKTFGKVSAVDYKTLVGFSVQYVGFGLTSEKDKGETSWMNMEETPLQVAEAIVKPCPRIWREHELYEGYLCVASKCGSLQYALHGDSGGPLIFDNKIVALVSQGEPALPETYYTPVSPYLPWIHQVVTARD